MTTSYELSLRLNELGVEQIGGEYYWVSTQAYELDPRDWLGSDILTQRISCIYKPLVYDGEILCRALTLGELVRMLPSGMKVEKQLNGEFVADVYYEKRDYMHTSPEEAAGELLAEIKEQEKQKEGM